MSRLTIIFVAALVLACTGGRSGLRLYVFDCGTIHIPDMSAFTPGENEGVAFDVVDPCFLIQHESGTLFWDAGLPDSVANYPDGMSWGGVFDVKMNRTLASQLTQLGIGTDEVDFVAFSHSHWDHVGNANAFVGSTWLIQQAEYEAAFAPDADTSYYHRLRQTPTTTVNGDHDVFGDGSVVLMSAPGHTPGHQVLFLDLPEAGPTVLSGDLYHMRLNREKRGVPAFNFDREQTLASMDRIEAFIAARGASMIIQHDADDIAQLPNAPEYLR